MNDQDQLETRLRAAFRDGSLPAAPAGLFSAVDEAANAPVLRSKRRPGAWPRLLALAAVLAVGGAVVFSIGGPRPSPLPAPSLRPSAAEPTLGGPLRITYEPQWTAEVPFDADVLATAVAVIQGRIDATGVTGAKTTTDDQGRLIVDLPAGIDPDPTRRLVGQIGQLRFLPLENGPLEIGTVIDQTRTWASLAANSDVTDASVGTEEPRGQPALNIELGHDAAARFGEYTEANVGSSIAITLDGIVVASPTVNQAILDGQVQISFGGSSPPDPEELARLAAIFRYGPMPVALVEVANGPVPSPDAASGGFMLNLAAGDIGCDTIRVQYRSVVIRIDPSAADPVWAMADTGVRLRTFWASGFRGGTTEDPVVYGPNGIVVARDGTQIDIPESDWPNLAGYFVCPSADSLYVFAQPAP